ncbi:unnamed protein product [Caenorhabditis nigoni]
MNTTRNVTEIEDEGISTYEERQLIFTAGVKESSFPTMLAVSFRANIRSLQYHNQQETLEASVQMVLEEATTAVKRWYFIAMAAASIVIVVLIIVGVIFVKFYFEKKAVTTLLDIHSDGTKI